MRRLLRAHQENPLLRLLLQHCRRARLGRDEGGLPSRHRRCRGRRRRRLQDPLLLPRGGPQPQNGRVQVRPKGPELILVLREHVGRRLVAPAQLVLGFTLFPVKSVLT